MSTYLLDTCILLRLTHEPEKVSQRIRDIISEPANQLLASAISAWEIAIKSNSGKLILSKSIPQWWDALLAALQVREIPPTADVLMASVVEALPHKDPADRMIVATARAHGARLLTADQTLLTHCDIAFW